VGSINKKLLFIFKFGETDDVPGRIS